MRNMKLSTASTVALAVFAVIQLIAGTRAVAQQGKVLHYFNFTGIDGNLPRGGLIFDDAGNLYGTTAEGGTGEGGTGVCSKISPYSCGTVFELKPKAGGGWAEKILHNFSGTDGWLPIGSLVMDSAGNLYGATQQGGSGGCTRAGGSNRIGCGTVFKLSPSGGSAWTETVLHSFNNNGTDGMNPYAGLVFDSAGNLYGTTYGGGTYSYGTVFELSPAAGGAWTESVLHSFNFSAGDGANPTAGVILDSAGNLYGTTLGGGAYSEGMAFELTPSTGGSWTETALHNFIYSYSVYDGYGPYGGLILDASGNLYGTTVYGIENGNMTGGTIYELSPATGGTWNETILYYFADADGNAPQASLVLDSAGNLYGSADYGGTGGLYGTVFELSPQAGGGWTPKLLYDFGKSSGADGGNPQSALVFDSAGNLYGTTFLGGPSRECAAEGAFGCGTVFEIKP
jgi:uncharacterized repeat protein (TIGR03803 family)